MHGTTVKKKIIRRSTCHILFNFRRINFLLQASVSELTICGSPNFLTYTKKKKTWTMHHTNRCPLVAALSMLLPQFCDAKYSYYDIQYKKNINYF